MTVSSWPTELWLHLVGLYVQSIALNYVGHVLLRNGLALHSRLPEWMGIDVGGFWTYQACGVFGAIKLDFVHIIVMVVPWRYDGLSLFIT
jgi:hypothetical protein